MRGASGEAAAAGAIEISGSAGLTTAADTFGLSFAEGRTVAAAGFGRARRLAAAAGDKGPVLPRDLGTSPGEPGSVEDCAERLVTDRPDDGLEPSVSASAAGAAIPLVSAAAIPIVAVMTPSAPAWPRRWLGTLSNSSTETTSRDRPLNLAIHPRSKSVDLVDFIRPGDEVRVRNRQIDRIEPLVFCRAAGCSVSG